MARAWRWSVLAAGASLLSIAGMAAAQTVDPGAAPVAASLPTDIYGASINALTKLAVIAIILEQALALIFDWKPFRVTFDRTAVKPLVSFIFAAAIVHEFGLDVVSGLITAYGGDQTGVGIISKLVTALVLAGGSSGINRILQRMGVRTNLNTKDESAPPPTKAFVSVVPLPKAPAGNFASVTIVGIDAAGTTHSLGNVPGANIGKDPTGIRAFFLQEKGRFPTDGGFALEPGQWSIRLDAVDTGGAVTSSAVWGPYQLDAGTQIDLTLKV